MYHLLSPHTILENFVTLTHPFLDNTTQPDRVDLKKAYRQFIAHHQPHTPTGDHAAALFSANNDHHSIMPNFFANEAVFADEHDTDFHKAHAPYQDALTRSQALQSAFQSLKQQDADFCFLFELLVNKVISSPEPTPGFSATNPKFQGIIFMMQDIIGTERGLKELMVHEFTHTALFLDERRHQYYTDYQLLEQKEHYIEAAISGLFLPIDRSLHSTIVSTEIFLLREKLLGHPTTLDGHPPTEKILKKTRTTLRRLQNHPIIPTLFTPRAHELLERCDAILQPL